MLPILGLVIVLSSVLGGFTIAGGSPSLLLAWAEYLIILGVGFGALLAGTNKTTLSHIVHDLKTRMGGEKFTREFYLQMLKLLYELAALKRKEGAQLVESHIEHPETSSLFAKYPMVTARPHVVGFICDAMRMILIGLDPDDLDTMLDENIESVRSDLHHSPTAIARLADSFPGIGIVAAVLGIVVTMQHIDGPASEIGHYIGAALIGTFLGVLLAYGVIGPIGHRVSDAVNSEIRALQVAKAALIPIARGQGPAVVVEFGRSAIEQPSRPSFSELDNQCRALRSGI